MCGCGHGEWSWSDLEASSGPWLAVDAGCLLESRLGPVDLSVCPGHSVAAGFQE